MVRIVFLSKMGTFLFFLMGACKNRNVPISFVPIFLFLMLGTGFLCFAQVQTPLSQIERSEELIRKEEALREKIEAPEKMYIEEITFEGAGLLSEKEIKDLALPYEKKWLTKDDISQIIIGLNELYRNKGLTGQLSDISYKIKDKRLIIEVKEQIKGGR